MLFPACTLLFWRVYLTVWLCVLFSPLQQEKDLHSGLIGPLVICKPGTLHPQLNLQPNLQEYALLFHTFDETKSWYLDENIRQYCTPPCQAQKDDPWFQLSNKFAGTVELFRLPPNVNNSFIIN